MHQLHYELKQLGLRHRDGSAVPPGNRAHLLRVIASQLDELGYKKLHAEELKGRHVNALRRLWQEHELAPETVDNLLAAVRWWAEHVGRSGVLQEGHAADGVPRWQEVTAVSKAQELERDKLAAVRDPYVRLHLELQRAFGLRREEAIKIKPRQADQGAVLVLQESWTQGGRSRTVPIRTAAQRDVLERAKALAGSGALRPPAWRSSDQWQVYESETRRVGLTKLPGLRYAYAQERYAELTGFAAPAAGGPSCAQLTPAQRARDREARRVISAELGHGRDQITTAYLGR